MEITFSKQWLRLSNKIPSITSAAIAVTLVGVPLTADAGRILSLEHMPLAPNAAGFTATGFGGWDLGNVEVVLNGTGSSYSEADGSYVFGPDTDYTYQANVFGTGADAVGIVLAKDWPVGEPAGIKIVNDDLAVKVPKPQNCIMATSYLEDHFLDSTDPLQVLCSGPFQSHKRYKLAMLPSAVSGGAGFEEGIDLVFNVEDDGESRDYQVFQKINNWTEGRLEGFSIQVGFGIGDEFTPASETPGVGVGNLSLSVPAAIWTADQLAVFSSGLFGPEDLKHDRPAGFFDPQTRAGFVIAEYPNLSGETDILTSGATLGSDYAEVPQGATNQFGPWVPSTMLPNGVFWDDDGNPETDAQLLAWYGCNPALPEVDNTCALGWMAGSADGFAEIPAATIVEWGENLEFTQGEIDDLVNVGLSYVVTVGDVAAFPDSTFTLRVTPQVDTSGAPAPAYVGVEPVPSLEFASSDGVVAISPSPEFVIGALLTARVGDADLNTDPLLAEEVDVSISSPSNGVQELTLIEQGENRGVFAATLPEAFGTVPAGEVVTVTYTDADNGMDGVDVIKTATTTAAEDLPPPPVALVSITDFSAPASLFVGQTAKLSVTIKNDKEAEVPVSGTVTIEADGFDTYSEDFVDLAPNKKFKVSNNWVVEAEGTVVWTATVNIDNNVADFATAATEVTLKPGKDNNNGNN